MKFSSNSILVHRSSSHFFTISKINFFLEKGNGISENPLFHKSELKNNFYLNNQIVWNC